MSEKNFWHLLRTSLPLKMYRVENRVMRGMPDIHYINKDGESGWIELKYLNHWPEKRVSTGLALNQVIWLKEYKKLKKFGMQDLAEHFNITFAQATRIIYHK